MSHVLIVGAGGFVGSVLRYWVSGLAQRSVHDVFPAGTLLVNVLGCLLVGVIWSLVEYGQWFTPPTRLFITVGILGGFTTFSAFGYETFVLVKDHEYLLAAGNIAANVFLGIGAVVIGWMAAKAIAV